MFGGLTFLGLMTENKVIFFRQNVGISRLLNSWNSLDMAQQGSVRSYQVYISCAFLIFPMAINSQIVIPQEGSQQVASFASFAEEAERKKHLPLGEGQRFLMRSSTKWSDHGETQLAGEAHDMLSSTRHRQVLPLQVVLPSKPMDSSQIATSEKKIS